MSCTKVARVVVRGAALARASGRRNISKSCRWFEKTDFRDPFPFPLSSDKFTKEQPIDESLLPDPLSRPNESLDSLRARLNYQSRKRGTLENDLLLSTFAQEQIVTMTRAELEEFDKVRLVAFSITIIGLLSLKSHPAHGRARLGHLLLGNQQEATTVTLEK